MAGQKKSKRAFILKKVKSLKQRITNTSFYKKIDEALNDPGKIRIFKIASFAVLGIVIVLNRKALRKLLRKLLVLIASKVRAILLQSTSETSESSESTFVPQQSTNSKKALFIALMSTLLTAAVLVLAKSESCETVTVSGTLSEERTSAFWTKSFWADFFSDPDVAAVLGMALGGLVSYHYLCASIAAGPAGHYYVIIKYLVGYTVWTSRFFEKYH